MITNKPFPKMIYESPCEWGRTYYVDLDRQDELELSSSEVFEVDDLVGTWEPLEFLRLDENAPGRALYVRPRPHKRYAALFSANGNGYFTRHGPFFRLEGEDEAGSALKEELEETLKVF
jgi:hypothetical protein